MSYFTRNMDKCSRLHSFPVTRYKLYLLDPPPLALKMGDQLEHL